MAHRANQVEIPKNQNYTMIQFFEWNSAGGGVHWKHYRDEAPRLSKMGITAAWLPPPTKSSSPDGVGYGIYDIWDMGEFDQKGAVRTKWGTKDELLEAIQTARKAGIVTYCDAVLNHKDGADKAETFKVKEVDSNDRLKYVSDAYDIEGWTGFEFPGRGNKYSSFKWNFNHFTGVDYNNKNQKTAIYKILGRNKDWADAVDDENSNYDYLMMCDIDHAHPKVKEDLIKWGIWVIKDLGFAGFRFDAIKHIDENFIADFVKTVRKETGKSELFAVGEFWKDSTESCNGYLDRFGAQFSLFDAPLHYRFKEAAEAGECFDLRTIFDGTIVQSRPIDAVTLVNNHDVTPGEALESWVHTGFMPLAYAFILLRPDGYPCVFYGDLYGIKGEGPATQEPMSQLADMIQVRKWLAYGECRDYWDHANCVGWVRMGDEEHDGCAVVICNGTADGEKRMEVGSERKGEVWTDILGWSQGEIMIEDDGWATFKSPPKSVSIWAKKDAKGRNEFSQC